MPSNSTPDTRVPAAPARLPRELLATMSVALLGALALWPYLFEGRALYWGDFELYFAPMQHFLRESLSRGLVPLWNPYILCGEPFVGNPQTWPLYPTTLLAAWISPWQSLTLDSVLHLLLGGVFFYALARDNARSRFASILAALSYMLGGYFAAKIQFPNMAQALAYVPAMLLLAGRLGRAPSAGLALALGFVFGLQLLAAHAQVALMTLYFAALYAICRAWLQIAADRRHLPRILGWAALAALFGACLDAGQLLPVLELWRNSDRQVLSLAIANRFVLEPGEQAGFFLPFAFGSPYGGDFTQLGNFWESACYLGVLPCLLAIYGAGWGVKRRSRAALFWLVAFLLSVWLAGGRRDGLYSVAFYLVPGVRAFHDPARLLLGAAVAGPMLAAIGFDALLATPALTRNRWATALLALVVIALTTFDLGQFDRRLYPLMPISTLDEDVLASRADAASLALPGHRIVFQADHLVTWRYFVDYSNYRRSDPAYFPALLASCTPNSAMLSGLADAGGYEPEPPKGSVDRFASAWARHEYGGDNRGLDALCVDSAITLSTARTAGVPGFFGSHRRDVWVNPHKQSLSRVTLLPVGTAARPLPVRDASPDELSTVLPPLPGPARVTIADTDMPGWRAEVSGRSYPVRRTSDGLREVDLPASAGPQVLVLRYRPTSWLLGLYVTLASLAVALGCAIHAVLSKNRFRASRGNDFGRMMAN